MNREDQIKKGLQEFENDGGSWDEKFASLSRRMSKEDVAPIKKNKSFIWILLAAFILISACIYFYLTYSKEPAPRTDSDLFMAYYEAAPPYFDANARNDEATNNQSRLQRAGNAYISGSFQQAYDLWQKSIEDSLYQVYIPFHGIAAIELGKYSEAISILQTKTQAKDEATIWYLGLAYLKAGDTTKALSAFREVAADNTHYKRKQANELIEKLTRSNQ